MSAIQLTVTLAGSGLIALIAWFFWAPRGEGVKAAFTSSGFQETLVLVKGAYTPNVISVERPTSELGASSTNSPFPSLW